MKTKEKITDFDVKQWFNEKYSMYNQNYDTIQVIQILNDFYHKLLSLFPEPDWGEINEENAKKWIKDNFPKTTDKFPLFFKKGYRLSMDLVIKFMVNYAKSRLSVESDSLKIKSDDNTPPEYADITWDMFIQYGIDHTDNIVNGMPWSFDFFGHPVTHENDKLYLIDSGDIQFTYGDRLWFYKSELYHIPKGTIQEVINTVNRQDVPDVIKKMSDFSNIDMNEPYSLHIKDVKDDRWISVEEFNEAFNIIETLCQLRHYKDEMGKDSFYSKEQPKAWEKAREFLDNYSQPPENQ